MAKRGPKNKISATIKKEIVENLSKGMGKALCCRIVGCHMDTLRNAMSEDLGFKRDVLLAERSRDESAMYSVYGMIDDSARLDITRLTAARVYFSQANAVTERRLKQSARMYRSRASGQLARFIPRIADLVLKHVPEDRQQDVLREYEAFIRELEAEDDRDYQGDGR